MRNTLEKLQDKQKKLAAQIRQEAAKHREREYKRDTRQKILLGAFLKGWCETDDKIRRYVDGALPDFLTKARDFEIFDLEVPQHILDKKTEDKAAEAP